MTVVCLFITFVNVLINKKQLRFKDMTLGLYKEKGLTVYLFIVREIFRSLYIFIN